MIYLLVIKLLEEMFKLVISGLHCLPQSLQYLQKMHIPQSKSYLLVISCFGNKNLQTVTFSLLLLSCLWTFLAKSPPELPFGLVLSAMFCLDCVYS